MNKKLVNAIRIIISLSLFSFLIFRNRNNFESIINTLKTLDIYYLVIALLLYTLGISLIVFRWGILLQAYNFYISRRFLWQSAFIGWFFNMLLPTSAGGDFYRVYDLYKNKAVPISHNAAAVVMERIIGTITGITLIVLSYFLGLFKFMTINAVITLLAALAVIIIFFILLLFPDLFKIDVLLRKFKIFSRIRPALRSFHNNLISYRHRLKYVAGSFLVSAALQVSFIISYYFISLSMGLDMKFKIFVFVMPFASLAATVPITIGGLGIRENALVYSMKNFGIGEGDAALFSLIVLAIILFNAIIGGMTYLVKNIFYRSKGII